ncbi:MAG: hypothetical protein V4438_04215 [Patescibacteria group bacterium]
MDGLNQSTGPSLILVKTALDKLRDDATLQMARTGKVEATDAVVFSQDTANNAAVVTSVIGGGGYFDKTTDDLALRKQSSKKAAAPKTTIIAEFDKNLQIARTFMADQQQGAVGKAVSQATKSWLASRDRNAISVYALGFGTTQNTTIDAVAPFSNSHVNQNGDTIDNLETGVLSEDNLNVLVNSLRTQINQSGVKVGYEPDFLLTPSLIHRTGMAIAKSVLRQGTGNNDLNYWSEMYPGMKVVYSPFLDEVSTTAYFIGSMGHGIVRYEREAFFTTLVGWETQQNNAYQYKMIAREEVDSIEYSGLAASNGTV